MDHAALRSFFITRDRVRVWGIAPIPDSILGHSGQIGLLSGVITNASMRLETLFSLVQRS